MNVCVVGSSPLLMETEQGSAIDSYDAVIRCNRFIINGYEKHVGTRTDYRVVNCHFIQKTAVCEDIFSEWGNDHSLGDEVIVSKDITLPKKHNNQKTINYVSQAQAFAHKHKLKMGTMAVGSCAILFANEYLHATKTSCYGFTRNYKGKCSHYFEEVNDKKISHNHERELQLMIDLYGVKVYE